MIDVLLIIFLILFALAFALGGRWNRPVRLTVMNLFFGGLAFYALTLALGHIGLLRFPGHPLSVLWTGPVAVAAGLFGIMGYALRRSSMEGRFTIKGAALAFGIAGVLVALTLMNEKWVDRHSFEPEAPLADSDFIRAHGSPMTFVGDTSEEKPNYPLLPGDRIRVGALITDWAVWFYVALMALLTGKRFFK